MKFSLVNVYADNGAMVDGYWLQNHIGTIDTARERARGLEAANGNRIKVAVVDEIPSSRPEMNFWRGLKAL